MPSISWSSPTRPGKRRTWSKRAEAQLPPSQAPLILARCCEIIGKASTGAATVKWYGDAKEWYSKAENAHPDDLSIKRQLAGFLVRTDQLSQAEAPLTAILKQAGSMQDAETVAWAGPAFTELLFRWAQSREQRRFYHEAENLYRRAVAHDDQDAASWNNLAWLTLLHDHNPKLALEFSNRAVEIRPDHPDLLDTRGTIYAKIHDYPARIRDLTRAIEVDRAPPRLFHLAQAYLAANDKVKAKQYLDEATTKGLKPSDSPCPGEAGL